MSQKNIEDRVKELEKEIKELKGEKKEESKEIPVVGGIVKGIEGLLDTAFGVNTDKKK
ncbi:MAG TPA: hypothetical protein VLU73_11945 [Methylococcaceae bacterium]|nr:hypothetical protein [Methylococcaceae bacterium]